MNRLIKVGTFNQDDVYVNPVYIQAVNRSSNQTVTVIHLRDDMTAYVNEKPLHVAQQINNA